MPKNTKKFKNRKTKSNAPQQRSLHLIDPDDTDQVYGLVERALGSRFFNVKCFDGVVRRCKARKKRVRVNVGSVVIVSLREFEPTNADIVHCYSHDETLVLQSRGEIPRVDSLQREMGEDEVDDEVVFSFDDI